MHEAGAHYLAMSIAPVPGDVRTPDIQGDVLVAGQVQKDWGLHLVDMNIAMGDLVAIVGKQAAAWKH